MRARVEGARRSGGDAAAAGLHWAGHSPRRLDWLLPRRCTWAPGLNAEAAFAGARAATPAEEGCSSTPAVLEFSILRRQERQRRGQPRTTTTPPHRRLLSITSITTTTSISSSPGSSSQPAPAPQHWAALGFFRVDPPHPHQQQPDIRILSSSYSSENAGIAESRCIR